MRIGKVMTPEAIRDGLAAFRALRDVPTVDNGDGVNRIDAPHGEHPKGTDIEDIWHAIEAEFSPFSVGDAMSGKYSEE